MSLMNLFVKINADAAGLEQTLKDSKKAAHEFASEFSHLLSEKLTSVFGLAALEQGIHRTVEFGARMHDLHERTLIHTDDLQRLDFMANTSGTSLESLIKVTEKLAAAQSKAAHGDQKMIEALGMVGVQNIGLSGYETLLMISDGLKGVEHVSNDTVAALKKIGGKDVMEIFALLREGARQAGDALGQSLIRPENIQRLHEMEHGVKSLWMAVRSGLGNMTGDIFGFFQNLPVHLAAAYEFMANPTKFGGPIKGAASVYEAARAKEDRKTAEREHFAERAKAIEEENAKFVEAAQERERQRKAEEEAKKHRQAEEKRWLEEQARMMDQIAERRRKSEMMSLSDEDKLKRIYGEMDKAWKGMTEGQSDRAKTEAQLRFEELNEEATRIEESLKKKKQGKDVVLKAGDNQLISVGNFLGTPDRGVVDKLDVIHLDLRQVVENTKSGSQGVNFPTN